LKRIHKLAIGAGALVMTASLLAMRPDDPAVREQSTVAASHLRLASLAPNARRDVDYAALDGRLQQ
jgi:hypothetical protein